MATYGVPDSATRRCGEEIARLREALRLSRSRFIARLYDEIQPDDPCYDGISEAWLRRLENGQLVKLPRQTLEAICRALRCTPAQRNRVLLIADRSVLVDEDHAPDATAELLNEMIAALYVESRTILAEIIGSRRARDLSDAERRYLISMALELALRNQRR